MFTPSNLYTLLGKRFKTSLDNRKLFVHYSKLYDSWSIYLVGDGKRGELPYHASLDRVTAESICKWLNNSNYKIHIEK
jgi:hypothetical protein